MVAELVQAADRTFRCSEAQKRDYVRKVARELLAERSEEALFPSLERALERAYPARRAPATRPALLRPA